MNPEALLSPARHGIIGIVRHHRVLMSQGRLTQNSFCGVFGFFNSSILSAVLTDWLLTFNYTAANEIVLFIEVIHEVRIVTGIFCKTVLPHALLLSDVVL